MHDHRLPSQGMTWNGIVLAFLLLGQEAGIASMFRDHVGYCTDRGCYEIIIKMVTLPEILRSGILS